MRCDPGDFRDPRSSMHPQGCWREAIVVAAIFLAACAVLAAIICTVIS